MLYKMDKPSIGLKLVSAWDVIMGKKVAVEMPADKYGLPFDSPYRNNELILLNGQKLAINYYVVEIPFTAPATLGAGVSLPIALQNSNFSGFLMAAFIWNIEIYNAGVIGKTPTGLTPISAAGAQSAYISLVDYEGYKFWDKKPFVDLATINSGKEYVDGLQGRKVNWQNSEILLTNMLDTSYTASTEYSIMVGIGFSLQSNWKADGVGSAQYSQADNLT